ncbi:synaptonemal complex protein 1-like isoform X2 [Microplitis mediator]|nr:synaptonemal complex protein 1-like isoform X2 [Microplitis mediator]XP_057341812.1 synaptonemal complex protein 1-like isoform X2 [Microplitis mediator]
MNDNLINEGNFEFKKILEEDRIKVMQKRVIGLFHENVNLKEQVSKESRKVKELEDKFFTVNSNIFNKNINSNQQYESKIKIKKNLENLKERKVNYMPWAFCKYCIKKLPKLNAAESFVLITKAELMSMEEEMNKLREELIFKEQTSINYLEREQNNCQQLTRLAQEIIIVNQLAENRYQDLRTMAQILEEKEYELKNALKEIMGLKKIIVKQEKRRRALGDGDQCKTTPVQISERECKWINTIMQQLSRPRKLKTKAGSQNKDFNNGSNKSSVKAIAVTKSSFE